MKTLAIRAGLNIFIPTPPKISFPITIPKVVATTICHNGIPAGIVNGISAQVTKKPSLTGCFRTTANKSSQNAPAVKVAMIMGKIL